MGGGEGGVSEREDWNDVVARKVREKEVKEERKEKTQLDVGRQDGLFMRITKGKYSRYWWTTIYSANAYIGICISSSFSTGKVKENSKNS